MIKKWNIAFKLKQSMLTFHSYLSGTIKTIKSLTKARRNIPPSIVNAVLPAETRRNELRPPVLLTDNISHYFFLPLLFYVVFNESAWHHQIQNSKRKKQKIRARGENFSDALNCNFHFTRSSNNMLSVRCDEHFREREIVYYGHVVTHIGDRQHALSYKFT